mmetsp:Transcript_73525/g.227060  ORF Transcript_73525/g.227060 Transcript_73525/m.227060 type:complete len:328 (+) Transcript_73525:499-1482(+)
MPLLTPTTASSTRLKTRSVRVSNSAMYLLRSRKLQLRAFTCMLPLLSKQSSNHVGPVLYMFTGSHVAPFAISNLLHWRPVALRRRFFKAMYSFPAAHALASAALKEALHCTGFAHVGLASSVPKALSLSMNVWIPGTVCEDSKPMPRPMTTSAQEAETSRPTATPALPRGSCNRPAYRGSAANNCLSGRVSASAGLPRSVSRSEFTTELLAMSSEELASRLRSKLNLDWSWSFMLLMTLDLIVTFAPFSLTNIMSKRLAESEVVEVLKHWSRMSATMSPWSPVMSKPATGAMSYSVWRLKSSSTKHAPLEAAAMRKMVPPESSARRA